MGWNGGGEGSSSTEVGEFKPDQKKGGGKNIERTLYPPTHATAISRTTAAAAARGAAREGRAMLVYELICPPCRTPARARSRSLFSVVGGRLVGRSAVVQNASNAAAGRILWYGWIDWPVRCLVSIEGMLLPGLLLD